MSNLAWPSRCIRYAVPSRKSTTGIGTTRPARQQLALRFRRCAVERGGDDGAGIVLNLPKVIGATEALRVNLVDFLGAGGSRREPPALGSHLQAADRRTVPRRRRQDLLNRI